jgi:hypothetical protein
MGRSEEFLRAQLRRQMIGTVPALAIEADQIPASCYDNWISGDAESDRAEQAASIRSLRSVTGALFNNAATPSTSSMRCATRIRLARSTVNSQKLTKLSDQKRREVENRDLRQEAARFAAPHGTSLTSAARL